MTPIRLLIVDDHPVVRSGLKAMLTSQPDLEVAAEAESGEAALALLAGAQPDVILMDLRMPGMDGAAAIRAVREREPGARILVLTTYETDADILRALEAGATGYLLKDAPPEELFRAVRGAARGELTLAPSVAARLTSRLAGGGEPALSEREIEVLEQAARGAANREIAARLHISEATVKSHFVHIFAKLGVDDRTAAVTLAMERKIIRLG
jgi:DNA-binding NarL/FixJ family response regulator